MTTEVKQSDQKRRITKVDDPSKRTRRKRCCRETSMKMIRSPPVMFPLQKLYLTCLDAFKGVGTVPSPSDDQKLRHVIDGLMPEDFELPRNLQFLDPDSTVVVYTSVYQCQNFSIYILFLPENAVIPLHNHPGMTVFSKVLLGKVHVKAYDLVNPHIVDNPPSLSQLKLACLKVDNVFTSRCNTSVLYPTSRGNIHAFTAITPCMILDVVGPSYSKKDGRDCSYYKEIPYIVSQYEQMTMPKEDGKCYRWLEEIKKPKESEIDRLEYLGPQIVEVSP
ncbi:hypothetical protein L2E82_05507 [Cichorium intybus]|uniref:Uncharacterized protein n=1 Tax=Cichorium intybus TaxID=13427 RepID=A0ACB9H712_CICIN|nr:hypothetical protein L2E82_05507 [Cichorium intybus]